MCSSYIRFQCKWCILLWLSLFLIWFLLFNAKLHTPEMQTRFGIDSSSPKWQTHARVCEWHDPIKIRNGFTGVSPIGCFLCSNFSFEKFPLRFFALFLFFKMPKKNNNKKLGCWHALVRLQSNNYCYRWRRIFAPCTYFTEGRASETFWFVKAFDCYRK